MTEDFESYEGEDFEPYKGEGEDFESSKQK